MSHITTRSAYSRLVDRLNRFPQGAPPSDVLYGILKMLFSEDEAGLAAVLPIKPFSAATAARVWKKSLTESRTILDTLASRGVLLDSEQDGQSV